MVASLVEHNEDIPVVAFEVGAELGSIRMDSVKGSLVGVDIEDTDDNSEEAIDSVECILIGFALHKVADFVEGKTGLEKDIGVNSSYCSLIETFDYSY